MIYITVNTLKSGEFTFMFDTIDEALAFVDFWEIKSFTFGALK